MARRSYTPEQRAEVLGLYVEHGPHEASRRSGVPVRTISDWAGKAGIATEATPEKTRAAVEKATAVREAKRAEKREDLRDLLLDKALDMLERMDAPHSEWRGQKDPVKVVYDRAEAQACQQYATATGILLDKFRLEVGESTERHDVRTRTEVVESAERSALRLVV